MSTTVSVAGSSYSVPQEGDSGWATDVTNLLIQLATSTKVLQVTSSSFPITQDLSFGTTYGLKVQYLKSQATNPSSSGVLRLGNNEGIGFRNQANTSDLILKANASNQLEYNGNTILDSAGSGLTGLITNAMVSASAAIAYSKLNLSNSISNADINAAAAIAYSKLNLTGSLVDADISASAAIALSKLAALTTGKALQSNATTGVIEASTVTNTELGYLSGVTSAIQTQIDSKLTKSGTVTGNRALASNASGQAVSTSVTDTELGYISGLTSSAQTQLDAKVPKTLTTTTGDMIYASSANTPARLAIGSSGQVLKSVGGVPTWATFSGGINYLSSNPDAEADTTGWSTYADAAGTSPVDGTGGSPNSTWTRTTSSPLRGSASFLFTRNSGASRQGEGVSYAFTIDTADKAKVLQIEFDYMLASGSFTAGTSSTDSELTVWIYDVTNSVVIQPSSYKLFSNSSTTPDKFVGNFQTASNSTSYRLIIHCGSSTNAAFTMLFDNFKLGPSQYVYGTPTGPTTAFTPSLTSSGGGSITLNSTSKTDPNGFWYRDGEFMFIQLSFNNGTGGAASGTAGAVQVGIPSGYTIDTTKLPTNGGGLRVDGVAHYWPGSGATSTPTTVFVSSSTTIKVVKPSLADYYQVSDLAAGALITATFKVPITGWSSSIQMSDNASTRVVAVEYNGNAGASLTGGTTNIDYATKIVDTHGAWNTGSGVFTAPVAGNYLVSASLLLTTSTAGRLDLYKNGSIYSYLGTANASDTVKAGAAQVYLNAGDTLSLRTNVSATESNSSLHHLGIHLIQGPSSIAATESIVCKYGASTTAVGTGSTVVINPTKIYDSHGTYNSSTGVFTCPISGKYRVTAFFESGTAVSSAAVAGTSVEVRKNSITNSRIAMFIYQVTGVSMQIDMNGSTVIDCLAGDTIDMVISRSANIGAFSLSGSNTTTYVCIERIGN